MEFATAKDIEPFFIWATQRLNKKEDFFTEELIAVLTNLGEEKLEFAPRIVKFADEKMQQIEAGDEFAYTLVLWLEIKLKFAANEKEREKVYQKYWNSPNVRNFKADIS